ncbi:50S ribosomal protein L10 [Caldivirga sp. UBA161]|uniref:50S ribosomal protein L10 n=1 Tax=Caldivirga sp. UBA161 TaxID=1915569 RepID=UPI0025BFE8A9|nr:50S ribosomal protein L10 [Caldivirga sp. UBA161]
MMASTSAEQQRYVRVKPYPEWKVKALKELEELIKKYSVIMIFDLRGLPASMLHQYRRVLREYGVVKIFRNKLFIIALRRVYGDSVNTEVEKYLSGENGFIFTNKNPFDLYRIIVDNSVRRYAKPGDVLQSDIIVPAGNTGINPGPVLSRFSKLKIPTQIRDGKIWVARDTQVAKPGDTVTPELADLLRLINVKPVYESLKVKAVLLNAKYIIKGEELAIDVKAYEDMFKQAASWAFNLAVNSALLIPETISVLIGRAVVEARNLALNANIPTAESIGLILVKAQSQANALAAVLTSKAPELGK